MLSIKELSHRDKETDRRNASVAGKQLSRAQA